MPIATLAPMSKKDEYPHRDIGDRIKELMRTAKLVDSENAPSRARLHAAVVAELEKLHKAGEPKQTIEPQSVSNWMSGRSRPRDSILPALATVLNTERENILFGSRRSDQLRRERQFLARVNEEEMALLTIFRGASKGGQQLIMKQSQAVAESQPAPDASIHALRRKDDRIEER